MAETVPKGGSGSHAIALALLSCDGGRVEPDGRNARPGARLKETLSRKSGTAGAQKSALTNCSKVADKVIDNHQLITGQHESTAKPIEFGIA
jgi:hypothetical protein